MSGPQAGGSRRIVRPLLHTANLLDDVERIVHDDALNDPLCVVREVGARADARGAADCAIARALGPGAACEASEGSA